MSNKDRSEMDQIIKTKEALEEKRRMMKEGKLTEVTVRVIKNHTINIPVEIAQRLHIKEGDFVKVVYDEKENAIKIFPYK
ncbi:hypothetical protein [Acidianus sulfidivorans]